MRQLVIAFLTTGSFFITPCQAQDFMPYRVLVEYTRTIKTDVTSGADIGTSQGEFHCNISTAKALGHLSEGTYYVNVVLENDDYKKAGEIPFTGAITASGMSSSYNDVACGSTKHRETINSDFNLKADATKARLDFEYNLTTKKASLTLSPLGGNDEEDVKVTGSSTKRIPSCEHEPAIVLDLSPAYLPMARVLGSTYFEANLNYPTDWGSGPSASITKNAMEMMGWGGTPIFIKTKDGYTITYNNTQVSTTELGSSTIITALKVTIGGKPEMYEAILFAADAAAYKKWLPTGPDPDEKRLVKDANGIPRGNDAIFQVLVRNKETKQPVNMPWKARFYLTKVSKNKGWSMNTPSLEKADETPDLRFDTKDRTNIYEKIEEANAVTKLTVQDKTISVISYDYAAYGSLNAEVTMEDGTQLPVHVYDHTDDITWMTIPLDKNTNHIADQWETDNKVYDRHLPDNWDEDKCDGDCNEGDGLTLFEEYRGFAIRDDKQQRVFTRLQPDQRKLFVFLKSGVERLTLQGIKMFSQASGIRIYRLDKEDDLAIIPEEQITEGELKGSPKLKHWINFNKNDDEKYFNKQNVCAIVFLQMPAAVMAAPNAPFAKTVYCDNSATVPVEYDKTMLTPTDVYALWVRYKPEDGNMDIAAFPPANCDLATRQRYLEKMDTAWGYGNDMIFRRFGHEVDIATVNDVRSKIAGDIASSIYVYTVAHEMGHAVGVQHHAYQQWLHGEPLTRNMGIHMAAFLESRPYYGKPDDAAYGNLAPTTGNNSCPMLYWTSPRYDHFKLLLYTGKWTLQGPVYKNAWDEPYHFCTDERDNCASHIRLKAKKK